MLEDKNNPDIKTGQVIEGFKVVRIDQLPHLNNIMYQLEHEETGAVMVHLSNDDDNNCFSVAFKTTPKDSTGVAHILEHTALCGSEKFPVRDPFFSMIRRSMKTFMNAFTASDWTMYPFSTQNEKDFFNLMSVYLDAAFFPILSEESFKQEGHRLEFADLESTDSPLTIQGIVYSEMKGAMSSQSSVMHDCTSRSLFPTITYKYNSGGDPQEIINLTHQQLKEFHQFHYHPSNAYFYTYGTIPLTKSLETINREVLSRFKKIDVETAVPDEKRYEDPKDFSYTYPLNKEDDDGKRCQVALAWLTCKIDDPLEVLSLQIINLILLGHAGAPVRKKLIESKLGKSLADTTGFEDEIREPFVCIGLQGVAEKDPDQVEKLIIESLEEVLKKGISKDQIESAIHQIEFDTREISGGHYPYSLNLLFRFFGTWIHGGDPVTAIDFDNTLAQLKEKVKQGPFLEEQIKKHLVDNPHRVKIVLKPDSNLEAERGNQLQKNLDEIKSKLDQAQAEQLISDAKKLTALQDSKEDLSILPSLQISDIPKDIKFVDPTKKGLNGLDVTFYERPTNGIVYYNWYFAMDELPERERIWLPLLSTLLMNTGAGEYSYETMAEKLSLYTGGFSASPVIEALIHESNSYREYFSVSSKALNRNQSQLFDLASLLMSSRKFDETSRIQDLITQRTNSLINSIVRVGHNYALSLATRNYGKGARYEEIYSGVHQIKFMKFIAGLAETGLEKLVHHLRNLLGQLLNKDNLSMLVIGDQLALKESEKHIQEFVDKMDLHSELGSSDFPKELVGDTLNTIDTGKPEEAWFTTTPVSYVAKSYKTIPYTHEDSAKLYVLSNLLKSCFLHGEIREKGGAYGAMSSYNADEGLFSLLSYRDPNLGRTLSVYDKSFEWLKDGSFTDQDVEETIIQTCSNMDTPASPAGKAVVEFIHERKGRSRTDRERFRAGVLAATKEDLIRIGEKHLASSPTTAAVTSEAIVESDKKDYPDSLFEPYPI